jgi:protoporphyrinogen oxidase
MKDIVLIGGSFTSMLLALKLKLDNPYRRVTIIEKEAKLGGLYKTFDYGDSVKFDMDIHLYSDTNDSEIDKLVYDLLPEEEWNVLEGFRRDIAGTYFNGNLQKNTSYADLRAYSVNEKSKFLGDMFLNIANDIQSNKFTNLADYLNAKFGYSLTQEIFRPVLEKHYGVALESLDPMATSLIPLARVVIYEENEITHLMESSNIRSRIAFPDQRRLPPSYQRTGRCLYPKGFGINKMIEALEKKLNVYGVKILKEAAVKSLDITDTKIQNVVIESHEGSYAVPVDYLFWGAGLPRLGALMNVPQMGVFQSQRAVFVNLLFDKPLKMADLYYFYVFDSGFYSFRVTNYSAYCPNAISSKGYPVCVCLWLPEAKSEEEMVSIAVNELLKMQVIDNSYKVNFSKTELNSSFPKPSVSNINLMDRLRDKIEQQSVSNLATIGVLSKKGYFYLPEILIDAFNKARVLGDKPMETLSHSEF